MRRLRTFALVAVLCQSRFLPAADLELTEDRTIDVPSGETVSYDALTGGDFTLTKTGGGTLTFKALTNPNASVVLAGGTLKVAGETVVPTALTQALFAADAGASAFKNGAGKDASSDYVGLISRWGNLNDQSPVVAQKNGDQQPTRIAGSETVCGLPLVDFGSQKVRYISSGTVDGYGGYMVMYDAMMKATTNLTDVVEVMVVAMDTEDVKTTRADYGITGNETRATPFVGGDKTPNFVRGNRSENGVNSAIQNDTAEAFLPVASGAIVLDGETVSNTSLFPDGLHLLEFRPTDAVEVSYLSAERNMCFGGVRLGAVALFTSPLSDADRKAVRNYLMTRWVPVPLKRLELRDGTTLAFEHAAGVRAKTLAYSGTSTVTGGALLCEAEEASDGTIQPDGGVWWYGIGACGLLPACAARSGNVTVGGGWLGRGFKTLTQPFFHVDASCASSLKTSLINGTNFVTTWKDADGGTVSASKASSYGDPFLRSNFLNGRPVVDFGPYFIKNSKTLSPGFAQAWSATCSSVREVVTVASDTEDLVENWTTITNHTGTQTLRASPFLGDSAQAHFIRGNRDKTKGGTDSAPILLSGKNPAKAYANALVTLDGETVAASTAYPSGFHILSIKPEDTDCQASAFATDRLQTSGGTRIAECYVFDQPITDVERTNIISYLRAKWFDGPATEFYQNLTVGPHASFTYSDRKVRVNGNLELSGKMSVVMVEAAGNVTVATNATLSGKLSLLNGSSLKVPVMREQTEAQLAFDTLVLPTEGTVTLDVCNVGASRLRSGQAIPLLSAGSVSGEATFVAGGVLAGREVKFEWQDGVLYAAVAPNGCVLIVR